MELVSVDYESTEAARNQITSALKDWYQKNYPQLVADQPALLEHAIGGVIAAYTENVFPEMKIKWGTYVNHITHGPDFEIGCFRCHDDMHESPDGKIISGDCNTCHDLLSQEEPVKPILSTLRDLK
jgi:hypothetical protein